MTVDTTQSRQDLLAHYQLLDGRARCAIAVVTDMTRELQRRHGLDPMATIALGRAVGCAALLASTLKHPGEFVSCSFSGSGPLGQVVGECNGEGHCRGYVRHPRLLEVLPGGSVLPESVSQALGPDGTITVTRGRIGMKVPHRAVAAFMNGGISSDLARFLSDSEQIPSAVAAGVRLSPQAEVLGAGAVLVQRLGGAKLEDDELTRLERKIGVELNISDRVAAGQSVDEIASFIEADGSVKGLLLKRPLIFKCSCSRDRMADALRSLGEAELRRLEKEEGKLEVRCHFCGDVSHFQLAELLDQ